MLDLQTRHAHDAPRSHLWLDRRPKQASLGVIQYEYAASKNRLFTRNR